MGYIIDFIFILVGLALILACAKRGLIKSAIHFCKTILAFVFAYLFGSKLGQLVCEKWILSPVRDWVYGKLEGLYAQAADGVSVESIASAFPDFVISDEVKASLQNANGSGEVLLNDMTDAIATPAATVISNVIGYVGVFLISIVLLSLAALLLTKLVEHISFLNTVNTVLGGVLGLLIALTLLFVAASAIKFVAGSTAWYTNSVIVKAFGDSKLLEGLKFLNIQELLHL